MQHRLSLQRSLSEPGEALYNRQVKLHREQGLVLKGRDAFIVTCGALQVPGLLWRCCP